MKNINHVAIIMDGNGRWGLKKYNSRKIGHQKGIQTAEKIIEASIKKKIKYLTLYTFSTENWKRPKYERNFLFKLLDEYIKKNLKMFIKNDLKLNILGDISKFSTKLKKTLITAIKKTSKNKKLQINLALNYGSKNEIIRSIKLIFNSFPAISLVLRLIFEIVSLLPSSSKSITFSTIHVLEVMSA